MNSVPVEVPEVPPARFAPQLPGGEKTTPPRTLWDILQASAALHPEATALDDGAKPLSYTELLDAIAKKAATLSAAGVRAGDRVGIRIPSGTAELYVSILATISLACAYVPVDADDPEERAALVFGEAKVAAIAGTSQDATAITMSDWAKQRGPAAADELREPLISDDAWIIFTSGSTGTPKGVAVSHRSAAAFVDAEARLFLQQEPLGPDDRVLAGLSVAFDASCEEMWLAWRHGAALVPAPRSVVKSGMDLGPWLISHGVSVVSTVPTLAALWPVEALDAVRLLIFGGEACPPELASRLAVRGREVWNTYGPTEATVVACAAPLGGEGPVRIGLPLDGWDLAVVDAAGLPVAEGEIGELIIAGVGLARYLDPARDAEKYAPMPNFAWDRAYRSGDLVKYEQAGLIFMGRADDQVKLGGRRIELGEIDNALQNLPGISGAAVAVKQTPAGNSILVGYLLPAASTSPEAGALREILAKELPAPLIPMLAFVEQLPTKISGKVDRHALPWPLPGQENSADDAEAHHFIATLSPELAWVKEVWDSVLGGSATSLNADFFASGGGSLSAAQLVSALRQRYPRVTVADVYSHPRLGALADFAAESVGGKKPSEVVPRTVGRTTLRSQVFQTLMGIPLHVLVGMRWLCYLMIINNVANGLGWFTSAPTVSWWWVAVIWLVFVSPWGRMGIAAASARVLLHKVTPGSYPRSGRVHLRLWLAEQIQDMAGAVGLASAPWVPYYARALGVTMGKDVDLHSVPPVTGLLKLGDGSSIEPEVDLSGWWIDGDWVHIGQIEVGAGATVGARSTLMPGARIGENAQVAAGSAVRGKIKQGIRVAGSPAERIGKSKQNWPESRVKASTLSLPLFAAASAVLSLIPYVSAGAAGVLLLWLNRHHASLSDSIPTLLWSVPLAALAWFGATLLLILGTVRLLSIGLTAGHYPVRSRIGWQIWATERVLDIARDLLFPIYASLLTPIWLRLLGAKVGKNVEASTVLLIPKMTTIGSGAFLADDTMIASYELGGGYVHIAPAKVGKRSFLGNSGMTAAGRTMPRNSLVAVLSATPAKAKAGMSWLGSPPVRLRRTAVEEDKSLTYAPPRRLKVARGLWETCRLVPTVLTFAMAVSVLLALNSIMVVGGFWLAAILSGVVMMLAGAVAAGCSVAAKWILVGRIKAGEHPLWSSFIWRNEVVDAFVELLSAPWFARAAVGTPAMVWWLRSLGAKIGHGTWCESYWLPEADLVQLGESSTVNRGCVIQTHLFHDRVMAIDGVTLDAGATMGPHGVILPAARIASGATVGPASLVMRGETVPSSSYWMGNPVTPWKGPEFADRA